MAKMFRSRMASTSRSANDERGKVEGWMVGNLLGPEYMPGAYAMKKEGCSLDYIGLLHYGKEETDYQSLELQEEVLSKLASTTVFNHVPVVHRFTNCPKYNLLIFDSLGRNVQSIVDNLGTLSAYTVGSLALVGIDVMEHLHRLDYVHQYLRPEAFMIGTGKASENLVLGDFSRIRRFRYFGLHIGLGKAAPFVGDIVFASRNAHRRTSLTRRDDLISLVYIIAFLLRGKLPWFDPKRYKKWMLDEVAIGNEKERVANSSVCNGLYDWVEEVMRNVMALTYEEEPKYEVLRNIIRKGLSSSNGPFEWVI